MTLFNSLFCVTRSVMQGGEHRFHYFGEFNSPVFAGGAFVGLKFAGILLPEMEDELNHPQNDPDLEAALEEALGDDPRADELRRMHALLKERRKRLLEDLDAEADEAMRDKMRKEVAKLDEQIKVLAEEADITKFVEDAVRVGIE